jgi:hypothetical protein
MQWVHFVSYIYLSFMCIIKLQQLCNFEQTAKISSKTENVRFSNIRIRMYTVTVCRVTVLCN